MLTCKMHSAEWAAGFGVGRDPHSYFSRRSSPIQSQNYTKAATSTRDASKPSTAPASSDTFQIGQKENSFNNSTNPNQLARITT